MSKGNPVITLRLTPDQVAILRKEAEARGQTLSQLIRDAIQLYLFQTKK